MGKIINNKGDVSIVVIALTVMFIILIIILFSACILYANMHLIVYNYKMDLYNLNKSAIISVNKAKGKYGIYKYDKDEYLNLFKKLLKQEYNLDDNLRSEERIIKSIQILEYEVIYKGNKDMTSGKIVNNDIIHVLTKITYKPIIFASLFKDNCTFIVHNDISIVHY